MNWMFLNSISHKFKSFSAVIILASLFCCSASSSAEGSKEEAEKGGLIVDTVAPPGATNADRQQWERSQTKIWDEVEKQHYHLDQGNLLFKSGRYQRALEEYSKARKLAKLKFEEVMPAKGIVWSFEAMGNFPEAVEAANDLLALMGEAPARPDTLRWKQALEAAAEGRYEQAVQYYRERYSSARDSEKKALFLEQRLRLMEDRAAGIQPSQTPAEETSPTQNSRGLPDLRFSQIMLSGFADGNDEIDKMSPAQRTKYFQVWPEARAAYEKPRSQRE